MKRKIVLFGGTFDPVHCGHVQVAEYAAEHIGGDEVVFVVAKRSPHKNVFASASGVHRVAMVELAIAGYEKFCVSDCELGRGDPSYTFDTVTSFRDEYGAGCEFYWLLGADMVKDLLRWYKVRELIDACNICVMYRGGFERPDFSGFGELGVERVEKLKKCVISTPVIDVSSTEIRSKLSEGGDVSGFLCPAVLDYIKKNGLYR